jgi:hypothetical protein
MEEKMEQRQSHRFVGAAKIYIFDQIGFCSGNLENVSHNGLCIGKLPRKIQTNNGTFQAIIISPHLNFKLQVKEKWETTAGGVTVVGGIVKDDAGIWEKMFNSHKLLIINA